jgi:hypothetical protein
MDISSWQLAVCKKQLAVCKGQLAICMVWFCGLQFFYLV